MHNGASLLLTADVGSIMRDRMFLRLQPHDDDDATLCVLSRSLRVATVKMDPVQVGEETGFCVAKAYDSTEHWPTPRLFYSAATTTMSRWT